MNKAVFDENRVILKDALDDIEQRLIFWKGSDKNKAEHQRLVSISNSVTDPDELMLAMGNTASFTDRAEQGWCEMAASFMQDHRDKLLDRVGDYSVDLLRATLSDIGDESRQAAILNVLIKKRDMTNDIDPTINALSSLNLYGEDLRLGAKDELRDIGAWDEFDVMKVTVDHQEAGANQLSTVVYGDVATGSAKSFTLKNPVDGDGQRQHSDLALLVEAKKAFYGHSEHYAGHMMRLSVKERVAEVDAILQRATQQPEILSGMRPNKRGVGLSLQERQFLLERDFGEHLERPKIYEGITYEEFLDNQEAAQMQSKSPSM